MPRNNVRYVRAVSSSRISLSARCLAVSLTLAACRGGRDPVVQPIREARDSAAEGPHIAPLDAAATGADGSIVDSSSIAAPEPFVSASDRVAAGWIPESEREPIPEPVRSSDPLATERCAPLSSPRLPMVPPELASEVARYRAIARRTTDCHDGVFRIAHRPSRRCTAWFAELARGGPAAMHALGLEMTQFAQLELEPGSRTRSPCGTNFKGTAANRAALTLASYGDTQAMPYLLRYLAMQIPQNLFLGYDGYAVKHAFDGVRRLARRDIGPIWKDSLEDEKEHWTEVVRRWGQWYLAHRTQSGATWQSEGVAITRPLLRAESATLRFAAFETLQDLPSEQLATRAARSEACVERQRNEGRRNLSNAEQDQQVMLLYLCGRSSPTDLVAL